MKIEKITLENFRAYKDKVTIGFKNLNLFVGKNDTGKSTILEALDIFFNETDANIKIATNDRNINNNSGEIIISIAFSDFPEKLDIDAGNKTNLKDEYMLNKEGNLLEIRKKYNGEMMKPKIFIYAYHPTNTNCKELLLKKNSELKKIVEDNQYMCADKTKNSELRKTILENSGELNLQEIEIPIDKEDAKKMWTKLQEYLPAYALFQSDRTNQDSDDEVQNPMKFAVAEILKEQDLQEQLEEIAKKVTDKTKAIAEKTLEKLREMSPDAANTLTPNIPATDKLKWADVFKKVTISSDNGIPLNKRGSGIKRLVLLNFFRAEAERKQTENGSNNIIYAIEEPETSQHLEHQKLLAKAIKDLSQNSQILVTSHSTKIVKFFLDNNNEDNIQFFIIKKENGATKISSSYKRTLSYISANEVNYFAFEVYEEEFHTELYGFLQTEHLNIFKEKINKHGDKNDNNYKKYIKNNSPEYITPSKYIRNQIHHPENKKNKKYDERMLKESIAFMRNLLLTEQTKNDKQ